MVTYLTALIPWRTQSALEESPMGAVHSGNLCFPPNLGLFFQLFFQYATSCILLPFQQPLASSYVIVQHLSVITNQKSYLYHPSLSSQCYFRHDNEYRMCESLSHSFKQWRDCFLRIQACMRLIQHVVVHSTFWDGTSVLNKTALILRNCRDKRSTKMGRDSRSDKICRCGTNFSWAVLPSAYELTTVSLGLPRKSFQNSFMTFDCNR